MSLVLWYAMRHELQKTLQRSTSLRADKMAMQLSERSLERIKSLERLEDFRKELVDRFCPLPGPAENMMAEAELRVLAERWQLSRIHVEDEYAVLTYRSARRIEALRPR